MAKLELLKKKPLLTPADVSILYGIPAATLSTWRDYTKAEGSVFIRIGRWKNGLPKLRSG